MKTIKRIADALERIADVLEKWNASNEMVWNREIEGLEKVNKNTAPEVEGQEQQKKESKIDWYPSNPYENQSDE